jgi:hypothetical protein
MPNMKHNTYVFRVLLKQGKYTLRGIQAVGSGFMIKGGCFIPMHTQVEVPIAQVLDLGKVSAVIRERTGNEYRAGSLLPYLDQSVTGFSGGTVDVKYDENQADDIQRIKSMFPALNNSAITKVALSPFDRDAAQKWWEKH